MKKLKIINYGLITFILMFSITISIVNIFKNDMYTSLKALIIIPIIFIPLMLRKILNIDFKYINETIFILFIFIAFYIGYIFNIYNIFIGYDKLIHLIFGIVASFLSLNILINKRIYSEKNKWFNVLFYIVFSLGLSVCWEFVEFAGDNLFGKNDQGSIETGVGDTMYDLLSAFLGSIIFCIIYYYEMTFKKSLVIKKYLKYLK